MPVCNGLFLSETFFSFQINFSSNPLSFLSFNSDGYIDGAVAPYSKGPKSGQAQAIIHDRAWH
jgi:hypothetical protein